MANFNQKNLRFLIVDDFSSFRSTLASMLNALGVAHIANAATGNEAIDFCTHKKFDVILCDYDLGPGKNGQRVLETIRHKKLIDRDCLFILMSADVSKQAVMAAYDCMPDDYMAKPINAQMLETRIGRLLSQRSLFRPIYQALDDNDPHEAMTILTRIATGGGKNALPAQKLLGEVFIEFGELNKAQKLYEKVLENKPLDWARLGLAYVDQARGYLHDAGEAFNDLALENPLFLPVYDAMARNWFLRNDQERVQQAVAQSVEVSPRSILRQQNLANVAARNGDVATVLKALRECIRLGRESCHGKWDDAYEFGMTAAAAPESIMRSEKQLPQEALNLLNEASDYYGINAIQALRMQFLEGRLHYLSKHTPEARAAVEKAEKNYAKAKQDVETDIARVKALHTLEEHSKAEQLTNALLEFYSYDQDALQRLDELLREPVTEANRLLVAKINREGIDLYNRGLFDEALKCFERAKVLFPKHLGIRLNIVQTLAGKLQQGEDNAKVRASAEECFAAINAFMDEDHAQYKRFKELRRLFYQ